jgi:hypothetical protein
MLGGCQTGELKGNGMLTAGNIKKQKTETHCILTATVNGGNGFYKDFQVWHKYPAQYYEQVSTGGNSFLAACILPAMRFGEDLLIEGKVSRKLFTGAEKLMQIINKWKPDYKIVKIEHSGFEDSKSGGRETGMFFSGGVDSFYTLLKNENSPAGDADKIKYLLFVKGFDIYEKNKNIFEEVLSHIKNVSDAYNKSLLPVETNIRHINRGLIDWDTYHGAAMMSAALGLEALFRKVYIAGSHSYKVLMPWGSHPLTDHLWSTESTEFVHDGCEASRVEKVLWQVGKSQVALDNLRVCWENRESRFNCCKCEKCLRTMLNLHIAGVLDKCGTFNGKLSYSAVANMKIETENELAFAEENYEALVLNRADPELIRSLKKAMSPLSPYRIKRFIKKLF